MARLIKRLRFTKFAISFSITILCLDCVLAVKVFCKDRERSIVRPSRLVRTMSKPEIPASKNTGATDILMTCEMVSISNCWYSIKADFPLDRLTLGKQIMTVYHQYAKKQHADLALGTGSLKNQLKQQTLSQSK